MLEIDVGRGDEELVVMEDEVKLRHIGHWHVDSGCPLVLGPAASHWRFVPAAAARVAADRSISQL